MAYWLVKSEPHDYAFQDLERDGRTEWSGVHNALALRHLRSMAPGDELLFYHSGEVRAGVGIARVTSRPRPDPKDARGSWTVAVRPVRSLRAPIALATIRIDPQLRDLDLLRITRLSVMPVSEAQWRALLAHEPADPVREAPAGPARASGSPRTGAGARRRR